MPILVSPQMLARLHTLMPDHYPPPPEPPRGFPRALDPAELTRTDLFQQPVAATPEMLDTWDEVLP